MAREGAKSMSFVFFGCLRAGGKSVLLSTSIIRRRGDRAHPSSCRRAPCAASFPRRVTKDETRGDGARLRRDFGSIDPHITTTTGLAEVGGVVEAQRGASRCGTAWRREPEERLPRKKHVISPDGSAGRPVDHQISSVAGISLRRACRFLPTTPPVRVIHLTRTTAVSNRPPKRCAR